MRLIFLGSPEPVIAPLRALIAAAPGRGDEVVAVVSQPARPAGRGGILTDPPVAAFAKGMGLTTLQPTKASDVEFLKNFEDLAPDVAITAAYGQILPAAFLQIPRRATINIHPSLLPRHRGATPVPAALLAGDDDSGVSILFTVLKLDAGAIIIQEREKIPPDVTSGALTNYYFERSGPLLLSALDRLRDPHFTGLPQDEAAVTFCRKIDKKVGLVDWQRSAESIYQCFRAYEPWPGSFTMFGDKRLNLIEIKPDLQHRSALASGMAVYDKRLRAMRVAAAEGTILIYKLTPAGGKTLSAEAFWNGLKDRSQVVFGSAASW